MDRVALAMLFADKARFIGIVVGLSFASLLITQQMAIFLGLMARAHAAVRDLPQAGLWVMDPSLEGIDLGGVRPLADTAIDRVRGVDGVAWAVPHLRIPLECTLGPQQRRDALLIGVDDQTFLGLPPLTSGDAADLRRDGAVLLDEEGAAKFARAGRPLAIGDSFEINDHHAVVVGFVRANPSIWFGSYIYTTAARARDWSPSARRTTSFIVAGVAEGHDPGRVAAGIAEATGLRAVTPERFRSDSAWFFARNTGIPINFGMAVGLGFAVGTAVSGMLFLQFTRDNLRYMGALKAMGASDGTLLRMTVLQAAVVGALGFGLGTGAAALFGTAAGGGQGDLAWDLPLWLLGATAAAVLVIVAGSSFLAVRAVLRLEPAMVFRG